MAKAREIKGIDPQTPFARVAATVVRVRVDELLEHSHGALDLVDIEGVHDARVATRRLRAALEVFRACFPKKQYAAVLREVKAVADALGERRDRDVAIAALGEWSSAMTLADKPGVASLVLRLTEEQVAANQALRAYVDPSRLRELSDSVEDLARAAEAEA